MATTLIDTRKSIMDQIHASWNEYRRTEEGMKFMFGDVGSNYRNHHDIPLAKDFTKDDAPWSTKQSVLERNAVHANKLIRLYIALNIDTKKRMHIWQFFEVSSGVVGRIKEEIAILKRIQKVLKLERELEVHEPLPSANSLYQMTGNLSLYEIEADFKVKVKEAKKLAAKQARAEEKAIAQAKRRNAALRRAKKEQKRKDNEKKRRQAWAEANRVKKTPGHTRNNAKALKRTNDWIRANKHGKTNVLKMLKTMERDGYTIKDVIEELERQLN